MLKNRSLQLLASLLFIGIVATTSLRAESDRRLSRAEAVADVDSLVSWIIEIHPDPFSEISAETFHQQVEQVKVAIQDSLSALELYGHLAPLTATLGDGHTALYFPAGELRCDALLFPLKIDVDTEDGTLTVTEAFVCHGRQIAPGTKIERLNSIPSSELVAEMVRYCSGERIFFRRAQLSRNFTQLLFLLHPAPEYQLLLQEQGKPYLLSVPSQPYSVINALRPSAIHLPYSFRIEEQGQVGVMRFESLSEIENFDRFLDSTFTLLKEREINHLVIDLRGNEGGNSKMGDRLMQYISTQPFQQFSKWEIKVSARVKTEVAEFRKKKEGMLTLSDLPMIPLKKRSHRYGGQTYILIDHSTYSSAASLSWAAQRFGVATIVGEQSGGMCIGYGNALSLKLPHSGLSGQLSFARAYQYGSCEQDIHGTLPDIEVASEQALERVLEIIGKHP